MGKKLFGVMATAISVFFLVTGCGVTTQPVTSTPAIPTVKAATATPATPAELVTPFVGKFEGVCYVIKTWSANRNIALTVHPDGTVIFEGAEVNMVSFKIPATRVETKGSFKGNELSFQLNPYLRVHFFKVPKGVLMKEPYYRGVTFKETLLKKVS